MHSLFSFFEKKNTHACFSNESCLLASFDTLLPCSLHPPDVNGEDTPVPKSCKGNLLLLFFSVNFTKMSAFYFTKLKLVQEGRSSG
jgi:hypothetical protein